MVRILSTSCACVFTPSFRIADTSIAVSGLAPMTLSKASGVVSSEDTPTGSTPSRLVRLQPSRDPYVHFFGSLEVEKMAAILQKV